MIRLLNPPYGIWTIWKELFLMPKLIFEAVSALCIYSVWTAITTVVCLRDLGVRLHHGEIVTAENALAVLNRRSTRLRQFEGVLFYLFGFVLFLSLQWAYMTIDDRKGSDDLLIMENFLIVYAFGANTFFLFAIIHSTLWFASNRVNASASKLSAKQL